MTDEVKKYWDDYDVQKSDGSWTTVADLLLTARRAGYEAALKEVMNEHLHTYAPNFPGCGTCISVKNIEEENKKQD